MMSEKTDISKEISKFMCSICKKHFSRKSTLKKHSLIHLGIKPYMCDICDKSFTQKISLSKHLLIHDGIKAFVCDVCGKSFTHKGNLTKHALSHNGRKPYECHTCGKCFTDQSNLKRHSSTHEGIRSHMCEICGKCFTQKTSLGRHYIARHDGMNLHLCNVCGRSYTSEEDLNNHLLNHQRRTIPSTNTSNMKISEGNNLGVDSDEVLAVDFVEIESDVIFGEGIKLKEGIDLSPEIIVKDFHDDEECILEPRVILEEIKVKKELECPNKESTIIEPKVIEAGIILGEDNFVGIIKEEKLDI